ncbi:MAG: tyrosine-type recombinase/integrase [Dorea sp.]|jgi:integrase|nr:tyrosine-type recombinase/integrase [Dorea sp.]
MPRRGENIFKRKDGRWEARYIHHYENGKAKYRYIYGASYMEVKAKRLAEQALPENNIIPHNKQTATFETLAGVWLADVKVTVKESTYTRYYRIVQVYLFPHLRQQPLSKIDAAFLRGLPEKLLGEGGIGGTPLSPKSVSDILCVLKSIFQYGRKYEYPCPESNLLRYPQKKSKSIKILTEENRMKLEQLLLDSEDTTSLGILFTMFTGVRIGELCGLRWEDIDFHSFTVHVCRTVERIADLNPKAEAKTKVVVSEPKTKNSFRIIPLPEFLAGYLSVRKRDPQCYLLTGNKKHTEPHQFYIRYQNYLRRHGIENHSFHALRHTFATRCVEMGFDTKSLSEILGHANINTTLSVYVHPSIQQKKTQMERLTPSHVRP